jgi:ubiquinol-cytochrome c reductase cytochrome b subunit
VPNKVGGIIAMIGAILILLFIPFTNTSEIRSTTFRPIFRICFWIFIADFILLTWIGQKPVRNNYIVLGQIATLYYFVFFLFIIPSIGIIESKLAHYSIPSNRRL